MPRHRGAFDPDNPEPYELSRSRVENFIRCKACFWLEQIHRVKPPEIPSFTINTTTDILLKRDADALRGKSSLPLWQAEALMTLEKTCEFIVIDCPGGVSNYVKMAHTVADILVTPMNDSLIDFDLLAKIEASTGKVIGPSIYSEMVWDCRQLRASAKHPPIDWVIVRNRISHVFSKNKYQVGNSLKNLSKRIGFRLSTGFSERVIFKELFLSGLTLLDLEKMEDWRPTLSHISARQEMRMLIDSLNITGD